MRGRADARDNAGHILGESPDVAAMNTRRGNYSSAESIAEVIFTAATDGTGQVMYLAGQDAEQVYSLRQSLSEQKRLEMVRQHSGL
jgi:hypothetical protein